MYVYHSWDEVWKLRHLPNLKSLVLSGNPLADVYYHGDDLEPGCKCSCHSTDNDNTVVNTGKLSEAADNNKVSVAVKSTEESEAVNSESVNEKVQIPIDNDAAQRVNDDDGTSNDDSTVTASNNLVETLQGEVRQYCENILNSVIDDIIRNEIVESDDPVTGGEDDRESREEEIDPSVDKTEDVTSNIDKNTAKGSETVDENSIVSQQEVSNQDSAKLEDLQDQVDLNKDKKLETLSKSEPVILDKEEDYDVIEKLSREIVELIIQKAFDLVKEEVKDETDVLKNASKADSAAEYRERKEGEMANGGKIGGEELPKEDNSCCPCEAEPRRLKPFISLETLCVSETKIGKWKHLSALRTFPTLRSVRIKVKHLFIFIFLCPPTKKTGYIVLLMSVGMLVGRSVGRPNGFH